jgi:hypothetical protein
MKWSVKVFERRSPREVKRLQLDDFQLDARTVDAAVSSAKAEMARRCRSVVIASVCPDNVISIHVKPRPRRPAGRAVVK